MKQDGKVSYQETSLFTIRIVRWLLVIMAVILFRFDLPYPALILVLFLLITELGKWWSRYGLKKIQVEASFNPPRLFAGETTSLSIQLDNRKLLPVILDFTQPLEDGNLLPGDGSLNLSTVLPWWGEIARSFTLTARKRGYYELPPAAVICSDGMGLYSTEKLFSERQRLIVYPRMVAFSELGIQATDLIGEKTDRRYILPDPVQVAGLRPYTYDLPARLINWKASAHQDTLMARILEPSADYKLCLLLDVENYQSRSEEMFELAISTIASIAIWADDMGIPYGVLINGVQKGIEGPVSIPVAAGFDHTSLVMEKLARLTEQPTGTLEELINREGDQIPWGTTWIVVGEYSHLGRRTGKSQINQIPVSEPTAKKENWL